LKGVSGSPIYRFFFSICLNLKLKGYAGLDNVADGKSAMHEKLTPEAES
jgi:hypothetical protein